MIKPFGERRVRGSWEETPRGLRAGCMVLWAVGAVLLEIDWRRGQV